MFPSIYLNCSDAPDALYPHLKKLLLFTSEVHIMNPHPGLLAERARITPGTFLDLCNGDPRTGHAPVIRPICRDTFVDRERRKARVDWADDPDLDKPFMARIENLCNASGRLLGEADYLQANAITKDTFERLGEEQHTFLGSMAQKWLDSLPENRRARFVSVAERYKREIPWIFVDTVYQELGLKRRSGAREHAPAPLDVQAVMYLHPVPPGTNSLTFPPEPARWQQMKELIDGLFPRDTMSPEQLSEMTAADIFHFRDQNRSELERLYELVSLAFQQGRHPLDLARLHVRDQIQDIEAWVTKVEAGTASVLTLLSMLAGPLAGFAGAVGSAGTLLALRCFFPRVQRELTYRAARHLPWTERRVIFSSCIFSEALGRSHPDQ